MTDQNNASHKDHRGKSVLESVKQQVETLEDRIGAWGTHLETYMEERPTEC